MPILDLATERLRMAEADGAFSNTKLDVHEQHRAHEQHPGMFTAYGGCHP